MVRMAELLQAHVAKQQAFSTDKLFENINAENSASKFAQIVTESKFENLPAIIKAAEAFNRQYGERLQTVWGDLRRPDDVSAAVRDQAVGHGRRVGGSPRLGARDQCGRHAEPHRGHETTARAAAPAVHVVVPRVRPDGGPTPPRTVWDPVQPLAHYARHKVECERLVRASGLEWSIFRLSARVITPTAGSARIPARAPAPR